ARAAADRAGQAAAAAQRTADQALSAATAAQACCDANRESMERMFKKSMSK
ncbi:MAG: alanine-zipper protein, partial [Gammaproteobacteria bacterium]|nr:alanine-zipper protein [Gammaproteobacteria bacterium]